MDDPTIAARKQIAGKYAAKYGLDAVLVCALAHHESAGWNQFAIRFEPEFYNRYVVPLMEKDSTITQTEGTARAFSWGLMQIMGQTARELGFTGRFLSSLCDPDLGLDFGCKKLKQCMDRAGGNVDAALLHYNGGSDPSYPAKVKQWISMYTYSDPSKSTHTA